MTLLAYTPSAAAASGTHFVVLIDDSGDMRGLRNDAWQRAPLITALKSQLYGVGTETADGARPVFDPANDHLSVVFFTIHTEAPETYDRCKQAGRQYSALPSAIFQNEPVSPVVAADPDAFGKALDGLLTLRCRAGGNQSPIITATTLVLPFLDDHLPEGRRFLRTLLIVVTNDQFNTTGSPAFELPNLRNNSQKDIDAGRLVGNIKEAVEEAERIAPLLRFGYRKEWTRESGPYHLQMYEVEPLAPTADALLFHAPKIQLDRVAVSGSAIELRVAEPEQATLRLAVVQASNEGGGLRPLRLLWRVRGADGEPWRILDRELPSELHERELEGCESHAVGPCRPDGEGVLVDWLDLFELPALTPKDPWVEGSAELEFSVELAYDTGGIYEHMAVRSSTHTLPLQPLPVDVVPPTVLSPAVVLDNVQLTDLHRAADQELPVGGLSQEAAKERVRAVQARQNLLFFLLSAAALVALVAGLIYFFIRTAYRRPFRPRLEWQPAEEVAVDFGQPSHSRLLVGTLTIRNQGEVPWFGRLLRHGEQPTRETHLRLVPPDLEAQGLELEPGALAVGFLDAAADSDCANDCEWVDDTGLTLTTREAVSDGKRVHLFLAAETLRDLDVSSASEEDFVTKVATKLSLDWKEKDGRGRRCSATIDLHFRLRIQPEEAREPQVVFRPASGPLFFQKDREIEVGRFVFESRAQHRFAVPFSGEFTLRTLRDHVPVAGDPLVLDPPRVELAGQECRNAPVRVRCDGSWLPNPEPSEQEYELSLLGPCHRDSETGPHRWLLLRDPTRAEIVLRVTYRGETWDVYWGEEGVRARSTETSSTLEGEGDRLLFEQASTYRFSRGSTAPTLLSFELGNSGQVGRGLVSARLSRRLELSSAAAGLLHLSGPSEDLLQLWDRGEVVFTPEGIPIEIEEGQEPQRRSLRLDYSQIEHIDGARLRADQVCAIVTLELEVTDDQGQTTSCRVELAMALELEQLPGLNWLCIDFGTSAIAAAVGHPDDSAAFKMIDLQSVPLGKGKSFANEQPANPEASTSFLPSWIVCDGDLRFAEPGGLNGWPAGFALHKPRSLDLRSPSFVGLPAFQRHFENRPGRVIFSLKQWLGKFAPTVRLGDVVTFEAAGRQQQRELLPLDDLLEASFAALAEAYLKHEPHLKADQVVLCHPNTFTARHRERFRRVVTRALQKRLGIAAPHHIQLVSESDAVAYHYCAQSMRGAPRSGSERILVYDFGAGTLDISIVRVDWRSDRFAPAGWTVEGRLGVPVAGNHFDELLARIVDRELRRGGVLEGTGMTYRFPLVADHVPEDRLGGYRARVVETWLAIRKAKHAWKGEAFRVQVGSRAAAFGALEVDEDLDGGLATNPPSAGTVGLYEDLDAHNEVFLSLPARHIREDAAVEGFVDFVTRVVIGEALSSAGLGGHQIDTLLISGRGALWPGLQDRVHQLLPGAAKPDLFRDANDMKDAVARGAIALQSLRREIHGDAWKDRSRARLGILIGKQRLILEDEWRTGQGFDLSACQEFRIVQVGHSNPDPIRDLTGMARHFYVDLSERPIRRDELWRDDPRLFVEVRDEGSDHLEIRLKNNEGEVLEIVHHRGVQAGAPPIPPWPVGTFLLDPQPIPNA